MAGLGAFLSCLHEVSVEGSAQATSACSAGHKQTCCPSANLPLRRAGQPRHPPLKVPPVPRVEAQPTGLGTRGQHPGTDSSGDSDAPDGTASSSAPCPCMSADGPAAIPQQGVCVCVWEGVLSSLGLWGLSC